MASVRTFFKKKADYTEIKRHYDNLFTNVFISRYKINGLPYQANKFLLEQLFTTGTVAILQEEISKEIIVSRYSVQSYNQYRYPYKISLINDFSSQYDTYINNENIVTMFATYTKEPVYNLIKKLIEKLVYIDILLNNNLMLQNIPFLLTIDDDSKQTGTDLLNKILALDIAVIQKLSSTARVSAYNLNAPYLIDKLNDYKNSIIGEILTILGINNNQIEKRERLISDEVNANNDYINTYYNIYYDNINSALKMFNLIFNENLEIEEMERDNNGGSDNI